MRLLGFDAKNSVLPAVESAMVHHYRQVRRVHPRGSVARVVLSTEPGYPGEIIEMPFSVFHRCVVKEEELTK